MTFCYNPAFMGLEDLHFLQISSTPGKEKHFLHGIIVYHLRSMFSRDRKILRTEKENGKMNLLF